MEGKVQSLPDRLRTRHPGAWTEEDVSHWVEGWGPSFASAAETLKENGVDGATIRQVLEVSSQSENDAKSELQGDELCVHHPMCVYVCVLDCSLHMSRIHGHHEGTITALQQRNENLH